jgi:hypothetical protein
MATYTLLAATLLGLAAAQSLGNNSVEVHPKLTTWKCTNAGGCKLQNTAIVLDAATHWIHQKDNSSLGCGNWGSGPDPTACPDVETCANNCVMEGIQDYSDYGLSTSGGSLKMDMYNPTGGVASPRVYLLAEDEEKYEMLQLTGNELTFDVDVSKLPCGMNGALYLSEMEADGGRSALNPGGASRGSGYCDAQCYVTPWINGVVSMANAAIWLQLTMSRATSRVRVFAATKWIFGKPIAAPIKSRPTPAARRDSLAALAMSATPRGCVTRMVVATILTGTVAHMNSMVLASRLTRPSHSLLSLSSLKKTVFSKQL